MTLESENRSAKSHGKARSKGKLLRQLREESLLLRAESAPHLRELLEKRIDDIDKEMSLQSSDPPVPQPVRRKQPNRHGQKPVPN